MVEWIARTGLLELEACSWTRGLIMSGSKIHPRSDRFMMDFGHRSKKVMQNLRSRSLKAHRPRWKSCLASVDKAKRIWAGRGNDAGASRSAHLSDSDDEPPQFAAPFSMPHNESLGRRARAIPRVKRKWIFGAVLDPQSALVKKINRLFLLACTIGMFVDPLFLTTFRVDRDLSCLFVNKGDAEVVTILRTLIDVAYISHIWLQLKVAYVSKKSLVLGRGELVWDARKIAVHYICACGGIFFDLFVILPLPQIVLWVVVPHLLREGDVATVSTVVLIAFLFQYVPKVFHILMIIRRMQRVTGYVFGTAWWGFALNLVCYLIAAHVAGSCWYFLGVQRVEECMHSQCRNTTGCDLSYIGCPNPIAFPGSQPSSEGSLNWGRSTSAEYCFTADSGYTWGIFSWIVPLVKSTSEVQTIVLPLFWGIMTLSSFGNALTPSNHLVEASFCVIVVTFGLLLFTMLIGNIQVFLHSYSARKESMQLKMRDLEWWMRRRQLPSSMRQRVRQSERQKWGATRGIDEAAMVSELPEGLRRDIKRHLCVDLVRRVPLFDQMDDLVVNNICDRLKPILFIKGETIVAEGDPVQQVLFIVRGFVQSAYRMTNGNTSTCVLGPGNFSGDELVAWCFRKPVVRLPLSNTTLTTLSNVEMFGFEARDVKYIMEHYRYRLANDKFRHTARYWSSNWRTWAAVTVQLSWRRFKQQREERREEERLEKAGKLEKQPSVRPKELLSSRPSLTIHESERLKLYTAMICSPKPQDVT